MQSGGEEEHVAVSSPWRNRSQDPRLVSLHEHGDPGHEQKLTLSSPS